MVPKTIADLHLLFKQETGERFEYPLSKTTPKVEKMYLEWVQEKALEGYRYKEQLSYYESLVKIFSKIISKSKPPRGTPDDLNEKG